MIFAQGDAGLGPHEYAERILDACSTYILHACSDPGPVSKRADKRFFLETSWSEDEEGTSRKHVRPKWDWWVPESSVIQQEVGQAFWIYRGHAQQVQKKESITSTTGINQKSSTSSSTMQTSRPNGTQKKKRSDKGVQQPSEQPIPNSPSEPEQIISPTLDLDDDEPDRF